MPRRVDHAERRGHLVVALLRVAARHGLHAVTMRSVAAEAGVSLRLVQYYFDTKAELLLAALRQLEQQSSQRWAARVAALPQDTDPRAVVEAFLAEALPTDGASRDFHLVWTSYAVLAMTDPDLAAQPFVDGPRRLETHLADILRRAQDQGRLPAGREPAAEATRLLALTHGLGTSLLVGHHSVDTARDAVTYHLDQLFTEVER
ncbi:TetR/AcrR family transcriptional regulator [Micromonospora halophytica]|uniref:Transcriptional regulator, TetR family n=1 Tax=Micromonospora halophytica TaxID=47864 RepID=A0A1C5IMG4_9ACTN|nr:TetR family transcriptional regulator C-terminal domain-containing protein [Micromonospora halophytica]SCG59333.1 transcriptional regulator, TetR family [Micromonospora halophytica]